jgi:enterochelin esterase family protein
VIPKSLVLSLAIAGAVFVEMGLVTQQPFLSASAVQTQADSAPASVIHPDRTVTFTVRAPDASKVEIRVLPSQVRNPLRKSPDGIWTVLLGPLDPQLYLYSFFVDDVPVVDPSNSDISVGRSVMFNILDVPSVPPRIDQKQDVPHGTIEIREYRSIALGLDRRMYVYLPPEYDRDSTRRFPVLYLRHGNFELESTWSQAGRAGMILDNLLAQHRAVPMIIVMPNGYPSVTGSGSDDIAIEKVGRELLSDIIPFVDSHYRTSSTPRNRALAGLSMGANQAFVMGLKHPNVFASVGAFSSRRIGALDYNIEDDFPGFLSDTKRTNANLDLLFLSCGTEDPRYPGYVKLVNTLRQHGIAVEWFSTSGEHEWKVWRASLAEMLPKLFRRNDGRSR